MKYRKLTLKELQRVEGDFIAFLAVNGVDASSWENLKKESTAAQSLIEAFSEVWFDTWLGEVKFVDVVLKTELLTFQFNSEEVIMLGLQIHANSKQITDLRNMNNEDWHKLKLMVSKNSGDNASFTLIHQTKKYHQSRKLEIFNMLENGGQVSDGSWFKSLALVMN